jgi:hypothetical protein
LKEKTDFPAESAKIIPAADRCAMKEEFATVRAEQADHQLKQGGFSTAVWPDNPEATVGYREVETMEDRGGRLGIGVADIVQFKHCRPVTP